MEYAEKRKKIKTKSDHMCLKYILQMMEKQQRKGNHNPEDFKGKNVLQIILKQ